MGAAQCSCGPDDGVDYSAKFKRSPGSRFGLSCSPTRPSSPTLHGRLAEPPSVMSPLPYGHIPAPARAFVGSPVGRQCTFSIVPVTTRHGRSIAPLPRLTAGLPSMAMVRILRTAGLSLDGSLRCATVCRRWNREMSAFLRIACSGCRAASPLSEVITTSVAGSPQTKVPGPDPCPPPKQRVAKPRDPSHAIVAAGV